MYKSITSVGAIAALAATATAHGIVTGLNIGGEQIQGWRLEMYYAGQNGGEVAEHAGWHAENLDNGFVEPNDFGTADIICHKAGSPKGSSDSMAKVAAGGKIDFQWSEWPESHIGPVITYVAPYTGDVESVKKEDLKWTKIEAAGYEDGEWAAAKLIKNNNTWTTTVPENLAAGKYVFRHEIIALHSAGEKNGAQAYPQCLNIEVTGSGSETPEGVVGTELYTADEEGIIFNPYVQDIKYTIPGPALWTGGAGSGSGATPTKPSAPASSSAAPSSAPSASAPASSSSPVASPVASPEATSEAEAPAASPSAAPESGSELPKTFTIDTFISWLEEKAGVSSGSNTRRHARSFNVHSSRKAIRGYY
jgi:hypothetical protein